MKKNHILLMLIFVPSYIFCQHNGGEMERIFNAKEITFYGFDYSSLKINDEKRQGQEANRFGFIWLDYLLERVNESNMSKWLKKEEVYFDFDITTTINRGLKSEDLLATEDHKIAKNDIQKIISEYDIDNNSGVGFVVIPECLSKKAKITFCYFVFFDEASKKVLWAEHVSSYDSNSYNRVTDWGIGLYVALYKRFIPIYNRRLKKFEKSN